MGREEANLECADLSVLCDAEKRRQVVALQSLSRLQALHDFHVYVENSVCLLGIYV